MANRYTWMILLLLAVASCQTPAGESDADLVRIVLPQGDPDAGRGAFVELRCTACHSVVGNPELPSPTATEPGPELGAVQVRQRPGRIASSIIAPSHALAYGSLEWQAGGLSRMGDYNDVLTVRQLIDLVSFVKSLPAE